MKKYTRKQFGPAPERSSRSNVARAGIISILAVSFLFYGITAVFSIPTPETERLETALSLPALAGTSEFGIFDELDDGEVEVEPAAKVSPKRVAVTKHAPDRVSKAPKRTKVLAVRREKTGKTVWPVSRSRLTSKFGHRRHPISRRIVFHKGIDLAAPKGAAVRSVKSGQVVFSGRRGGYGLTVDIRHKDGVITRYAHNSALLVKVGSNVKAGSPIAKVGSTGHSTGPHVHLEVIRNGERINPLKYLSRS